MSEDHTSIKIGELLVAVGIVSTGDLQEAIQISKRMNLPIGRVIVMSGLLNDTNLHHAIEAQSLIRDGILNYDMAIAALKKVFETGKGLQDALSELSWAPKKDAQSNKLGELLIDAGMVTQTQLDLALQVSYDTGLPLGGTLVQQGIISAQLLPVVLSIQEKIREGKVNRQAALADLQASKDFLSTLKTDYGGWNDTESDFLQNNVEEKNPAPDLQVGQNFYAGLAGSLSGIDKPINNYDNNFSNDFSSQKIMAQPRPSSKLTLLDLLKMSGCITENDLEAAFNRLLNDFELSGNLAVVTELANKSTVDNCVKCCTLLEKKILNPEQAVFALSLCRTKGLSLEQAFQEMGITVT